MFVDFWEEMLSVLRCNINFDDSGKNFNDYCLLLLILLDWVLYWFGDKIYFCVNIRFFLILKFVLYYKNFKFFKYR